MKGTARTASQTPCYDNERLSILQGIEKKRSTLHGSEKGVVARHEAGHAVVGTAVAKFIPGLTRVQVLPILNAWIHLLLVLASELG